MCCLATSAPPEMKLNLAPFERPAVVSPPPRKHVTFATETTEYTSSPLSKCYNKQELWYPATDLACFRAQARDLCRQMRILHEQQQQPTQRTCSLAMDLQTRGLEQRSCLERQRRKYLANRFILKAAAKCVAEPEKLATLCQKITAWAAELAVEEGARDYGRAYHSCVVATGTNEMSSSNKRLRQQEDDCADRRVRARC